MATSQRCERLSSVPEGAIRCTVGLSWTGDPRRCRYRGIDVVAGGAAGPDATTRSDCDRPPGDTCRIDVLLAGAPPTDAPASRLRIGHNLGDPIEVTLALP